MTGGPDTGLGELDVLNYWRANPVAADEILANLKIDAKDHTHVEQAMQRFGGVYWGIPSARKLHSGV